MKFKSLVIACFLTLSTGAPAQAWNTSLTFGDLVDVEGTALYYGNLRLEYERNRWVYQLEYSRNINQLEVENRVQNREEEIDIQNANFALKYKALSYMGATAAVDYIDFTKSDATLWGVGGWIKYPITKWFMGDKSKEKRIDFEAVYFINDLNAEIDLDTSYFYKASLIVFTSDAFYTKFVLGYKAVDLSDTKKDVDFAIKSPLVEVGLGYIF